MRALLPPSSSTAIGRRDVHCYRGKYLTLLQFGPITRSLWASSAVFWLLAFQVTALATSGPWLVALCLTNSSSVGAVFAPSRTGKTALADPNAIHFLPASIALGYVLPLVLMSIPSPSVVSNSFQQLAIAAWNLFPLLVAVAQSALGRIASLRGSSRQPFSRSASLKAVRFTYGLTVMFCFASHIAIISFSSCSALFPSVFAPHYASAFRITKVFRLPLSLGQVSSVGEGATQFMQWDMAVGFAAMLSLGSITCMKALMVVGWYSRMRFITFVLTGSLIMGPGTTLLLVNWIRDEHLLATGMNGKTGEMMG